MRRPYYRRTNPSGSIQKMDVVNSIQEQRLRILNIMLICASIVGLLAVVGTLIAYIPERNYGMVIVTTTAFLWILWITIDRKLPYLMRAVGFAVLPYMLGVAAQFQYGIAGNSRVWLLGFSALTAIILGFKAGIGAIILSILTLFGSVILANRHWIKMPEPALTPTTASFVDWILTGGVWLLISGIVIVTSTMLIQGLTSSLEKERSLGKLLELDREHLDRRTRELDRRLVQLRTAAEVSRSLSGLMDPSILLQQVVDLMHDRFGLYYVGVFLLDEKGENTVLRAGNGDAGKDSIPEGYQLPILGDTLVGWAIINRKPRIAHNIVKDPTRLSILPLPQTHSEMALPLISGERVFGALTVQSKLPDAFDQDDVIVLQGIADTLATSLQNATLFEESKERFRDIQALNRQYVLQAWKKVEETPNLQQAIFEDESTNASTDVSLTQRFPIQLRGQTIGQLSLETDRQTLTPEEQTLIQEVTTQAALAMENIRLLEESQRRASLEHLLSTVVQNVRSQADLEMILRSTIGGLGKALGATDGILYLTPEFLSPGQKAPNTEQTGDNSSHHQNEQELEL